MAEIKFIINDLDVADYIDAFGRDYQETIDDQPNPQTKAQFARKVVARLLASEVRNYRKSLQLANLTEVASPDIT